jgi:hypothetical protein
MALRVLSFAEAVASPRAAKLTRFHRIKRPDGQPSCRQAANEKTEPSEPLAEAKL